MAQGLIQRQASPAGRGRPSHAYSLTDLGRREAGHNFVDLALVLWQEVRAIPDLAVRRGLLQRIAKQMAGLYADRIGGTTAGQRMREVAAIFSQRNVPFIVEEPAAEAAPLADVEAGQTTSDALANAAIASETAPNRLPVLTALACPYPQLAEQDRGICALERMMIAELVQQDVKLSACRLDGDSCCRFQTN